MYHLCQTLCIPALEQSCKAIRCLIDFWLIENATRVLFEHLVQAAPRQDQCESKYPEYAVQHSHPPTSFIVPDDSQMTS